MDDDHPENLNAEEEIAFTERARRSALHADVRSSSRRRDNASALLRASESTEADNTGVIQELLRKGAPIEARDFQGAPPLTYAALKGNTALVDTLIKAGADINTRDNDGETPLMRR